MFVNLKKGFTLIELLVVIAIIAILAAILFPVFAQAREKARSTKCLSNMKQIGTSLMLYADDYDGIAPSGMGYFGYTDFGSMWSGGVDGNHSMQCWTYGWYAFPLAPYTKNESLFECPSAGHHPADTKVNNFYQGGNKKFHSIAMKQDVAMTVDLKQAPFDQFLEPSKTIVLYERHDWHGDKIGVFSDSSAARKINVTYADGHAKLWKGNTSPYGAKPYEQWFNNLPYVVNGDRWDCTLECDYDG